MIIDSLKNSARYLDCHPGFKSAFNFLESYQEESFTSKRLDLNSQKLIAIFDQAEGRTRAKAPLEAHRRYIDIQYIHQGVDEMGWRPLESCLDISQPYNPEKDLLFFADEPSAWLKVPPGFFAIFFPEDAHAPLAGIGKVEKIILKVAVDYS